MKYEVYVVFCHREHWFNKFLKPGFCHIYMLRRDEYNWMVMDPHCRLLTFAIPDIDINVDLPYLIKTSDRDLLYGGKVKHRQTVIRVELEYNPTQKPFLSIWPQLNCVGIAMYGLGISEPYFTPYQLYKFLLRQKQYDTFAKPITRITLI